MKKIAQININSPLFTCREGKAENVPYATVNKRTVERAKVRLVYHRLHSSGDLFLLPRYDNDHDVVMWSSKS